VKRCPLALVALFLLALPGCVAGISGEEVPVAEIALYWYDVETERRRAEAIEAAEGTGSRSRQGVAHVEDVSGYLGRLLGSGADAVQGASDPELHRRHPGRLAFLDPHREVVRPLERAFTGAIPRDWSAARERLLYSQVVGRYRQMFEYRLADGEVRQLTRWPGVHPDGCFLPDGRYVFARAIAKGGQAESVIVLADAGGANARAISEGPGDYSPACAPDGSAVAWVAAEPRGRDRLMSRIPPEGGELRTLGAGRSPSFSPDGQWLAYSALVDRSHWQLARIRPDGSGRKTIGESTLDELQPSFSPDGRLVIYVADDGYYRRIYMRRFDGTGDRVLLRSGGGEFPVW
jgi:hypothetical protein